MHSVLPSLMRSDHCWVWLGTYNFEYFIFVPYLPLSLLLPPTLFTYTAYLT
uniref:Uncharacterized protein n=2 Tax=Picea TaxID=3328 RepID=A0A117NI43_PICGL|nr:hypothetical protein ABT39_MTgene3907 [Picea glauca]QHR90357.1 hypothetical protein Q903MT_gene4380 [Picea sitchensis]